MEDYKLIGTGEMDTCLLNGEKWDGMHSPIRKYVVCAYDLGPYEIQVDGQPTITARKGRYVIIGKN